MLTVQRPTETAATANKRQPHSLWTAGNGFRRLSYTASDLAASPSKVCQPPPGGGLAGRKLSSGSWPVPAHWTVCVLTTLSKQDMSLTA